MTSNKEVENKWIKILEKYQIANFKMYMVK